MTRRRKGIIVFTLITAGSVASAVGGLKSRNNWSRENPTGNPVFATNPRAEGIVKRPKKDYIAALYLTGELMSGGKEYNHAWTMQTLDDLTNDEHCRGILLYLDTPGGGVYEADEVYLSLMKYKGASKEAGDGASSAEGRFAPPASASAEVAAAAQEGGAEGTSPETPAKSIIVYMGPLAASGGYYIACAADGIWANRNTLTGSIGVIAGRSVDATTLLDKLGVKSETITAGRNKNMMGFDAPFTEEQRTIAQSIADDAYDQFTGIVAAGRGMEMDKVRELADGRVYTARQAKEAGLIDSIGTWDDALADLRGRINDEECKVITFQYERKESILDMVRGSVDSIVGPRSLLRPGIPAYLYRP